MNMLLIYGVLQTLVGIVACAWGTAMKTQTAQFPGNARIRTGTAVALLGTVCFTLGGITVFMSF